MEEIKIRRSIREFKENDSLSKEILTQLVKAGMQAPSAMNAKPWCFMIIDEQALINKIANHPNINDKVAKATALIIVMADLDKVKSALFHQDLAAATQNILLEATHLKIGSYWIGIYETQSRKEAISEVLELPSNIEPFSMIALGHPINEDAFYFRDNYDPQLVKVNGWK